MKINIQRFAEEENLEEIPENVVEQTTEEVAGGNNTTEIEQVEEKLYTESEFNQKFDEQFKSKHAKKMALREREIRREYETKNKDYEEISQILNAGLGTTNIKEAKQKLIEFWKGEGIEVPEVQIKPEYSDDEQRILSAHYADEIINLGYDEVVEEVERLAKIGPDNMSKRDKMVFEKLANERIRLENNKSLKSIGVDTKILENQEFKEFASMFNSKTPITKVVEMFNEKNKVNYEQIGDLKNNDTKNEKTYYTPEEAKKLTREQLKDPTVYENVRKSMQKWEKGK